MKTIKDYPMQTVIETPDHIMWIFSGEWSPLDNFALTPVRVDVGHGVATYPTSEHAFAAAKTKVFKTAEGIRLAETPGLAKMLGRGVVLRMDWETVKFEMMWQILVAKFKQHPQCVKLLRSTGERPIYEGNTWDDDVWGVLRVGHKEWRGRNALGVQLMSLRDKYNGVAK